MQKIRIGYWAPAGHVGEHELPYPKDFVDEDWDPRERDAVLEYLRRGRVETSWRGWSVCRICFKRPNGSQCHTDGKYVWPQGYAHYIEEHCVKPPQDFIDHVLGR